MAGEATVDRFGRIVIPKKARDRFGLEAGSALEVDEREDGILLRPTREQAPLRVKGSVSVFSGELVGDAESAVQRHRQERIRRFHTRSKR